MRLVRRARARLLPRRRPLRFTILLHGINETITWTCLEDDLLNSFAERHGFLVHHENNSVHCSRRVDLAGASTEYGRCTDLRDVNWSLAPPLHGVAQEEGPR